MSKARVFLDTSLLVAALVKEAPGHEEARRYLERLHSSGEHGWISRQVLREFMATLTRPQPYASPVPGALVAPQVERLVRLFKVAEEGADSMRFLLEYLKDGRAAGKQVHDAAIAAVMRAAGITRLATLNRSHFARFEGEIRLEALAHA